MVALGSDAKRDIEDIALTRYACYLIAMNADSYNPQVANAQTYFAIKTRLRELDEQSTEVEKRLELRNKVANGVYSRMSSSGDRYLK